MIKSIGPRTSGWVARLTLIFQILSLDLQMTRVSYVIHPAWPWIRVNLPYQQLLLVIRSLLLQLTHDPLHTQSGISKPNPRCVLSIAASPVLPPKNTWQALASPELHVAMAIEYNALVRNQTWELIDMDPNDNLINSLWVFKVKHRVDGTIELLKAWLVANGSRQIQGLDYHDTFSPVV